MFGALHDCFVPLSATKHVEDPEVLLEQFHEEICGYFRQVRLLAGIYISFIFTMCITALLLHALIYAATIIAQGLVYCCSI